MKLIACFGEPLKLGLVLRYLIVRTFIRNTDKLRWKCWAQRRSGRSLDHNLFAAGDDTGSGTDVRVMKKEVLDAAEYTFETIGTDCPIEARVNPLLFSSL